MIVRCEVDQNNVSVLDAKAKNLQKNCILYVFLNKNVQMSYLRGMRCIPNRRGTQVLILTSFNKSLERCYTTKIEVDFQTSSK